MRSAARRDCALRWPAIPAQTAARSPVWGPHHIAGDEITIKRQKTGVSATITMHPQLRAVLDATPLTGFLTFLVTKTGKPYAPCDLSDEFRGWCDDAAIPKQYTLHGLRHALGDALAEAGASPNEIGAVPGHASAKTSLHYTQGANRAVLGRQAMARLIAGPNQARSANAGVSEDNTPQTLRTETA